jgi:general secretion pathway protein N
LILGANLNAQPAGQPADGLVNPLQAQSLDRLSATRDHPLFSPSRRPVPPPPPTVERAPEAAAPPPPPNVTVIGIVVNGEGARAIIRSDAENKFDRVQIGDDIGGWKVSQIEGRRMVLSLDGRLATFTLFSDERGKRSPDSPAAAIDKVQNESQRNRVQEAPARQADSQPAPSRKRRKSRE